MNLTKLAALFAVVVFLFFPEITHAQQSVGIGTNTPNPRSVLELVSPGQNQGFLLPRLSTAEINAIPLVAADRGLMVFDNTTAEIKYWDGALWQILGSGGASTLHALTDVTLTAPATGNFLRYNGTDWVNTSSIFPINETTAAAGTQFQLNQTGPGTTFRITNSSPLSTDFVMSVEALGDAIAGYFVKNNPASTNQALYTHTLGTGPALVSFGLGNNSSAARFANTSIANGQPTVIIENSGTGLGLNVVSGAIRVNSFGGGGTQMVVTNNIGVLGTAAIPSALGTVTSVGTGTGLTGGPITTTGTISLSNSGVTAGSYGTASAVGSFSVDATGRIISAVDVPIALNASQITAGTLPLARGGTGAGTAAAARTNLGLGTMALQNATAVTITGGAISGLTTPLEVGSGGTGTNSVTSNGVAYGGAGVFNYTAAGTSGQILQVNGSGQPEFVSPNALGWGLTGNSGTSSTTNFIGTTDLQSLNLRTNNITRMSIGTTGNVGINVTNPGYRLDVDGDINISTGSRIRYNGNSIYHNPVSGTEFIGQSSNNTVTGTFNTVVGAVSGVSLTSGNINTVLGSSAFMNATTAQANVAIGYNSIASLTTGGNNVAVGYQSMLFSNGSFNTAIGHASHQTGTTGFHIAALGYQSYKDGSGTGVTAIGSQALQNATTGAFNTSVGFFTLGSITTGDRNTAIGYNADITLPTATNSTAIGNEARVGASNSIVLGGTGLYAVNVGIGTRIPALLAGSNQYLSVVGPVSGTSNRSASLELVGNTGAFNTMASKVDFLGIEPITDIAIQRARVEARSGNGATGAGQLVFYTNNGTSAASIFERMRIRENGSVGIGNVGLVSAMLSVGTANQFQISSTGNLLRVNDVPYSWPNANSSGVLTNDGAGGLSWAPSPVPVLISGNGITVSGSQIALGGNMTLSETPLSSTIDNRLLIQSSNSAINTVSGVRLRMSDSFIGRQWDILSRKRDNVANSGQSDFLINNVFSTAGGFIESFKIDGSNSNVIINADKTSASPYGNFIVANGNMGVGTGTPASKLHVSGTTVGPTRAGGTLLDVNTTTTDNNAYIRFTQDGAGLQNPVFIGVDNDNGISEFWNQDALAMRFGTTNLERMRITAAGNVGIGSSNPTSLLGIYGTIPPTASFNEGVFIDIQNAAGVANHLSGIRFKVNSVTTNDRFNAALFYRLNASVAGELNFAIKANSIPNISANDIKMTITEPGDVGIGTNTPDSRLHVAENIADLTGVDGAFVDIQNLFNSASTGYMTGIRFRTDGVIAGADARFKGGIFFRKTGSFGVGDMIFALNNAADNTSATSSNASMTILSSGNVGIGTSAPVRLLDIQSTGFQAARVASSNNLGAAFELVRPGAGNNDFRIFNNAVLRIQHGGITDDLFTSAVDLMTINSFGNVAITGSLSKASGTFKIDHPSDPANKYLVHSFVESPDMMNIYNGNVVTNSLGEALISLPEYFGILNKDFRYQLTPIGVFSQAIVLEEINEITNAFKIKTDQPNIKVSWQVTGTRKDPYANANRVKDVVEKSPEEKGYYLHPQLYGQPVEKHIGKAPVQQESGR